MKKEVLQNIIFKYNLEGLVEIAKWSINSNKIEIPFITPDKDMFGRVKADFPNIDSEFIVYGTDRLIKLLSITDEDVDVKLDTDFGRTTKMTLLDSSYELVYILGDMMLAPSLPKKLSEPDKYDIEFDIDANLANKFIKAKKSVATENVFITPTQNQSLKFVIGNTGDFTDKVNFEHPAIYDTLAIQSLQFPVEYIKNIFINNKCNGKGFISMDGLVKFQFEENDIHSEYFLIAK